MKTKCFFPWVFSLTFWFVILMPGFLQIVEEVNPQIVPDKMATQIPAEFSFHLHNGKGVKGKIKGILLDAKYFLNNFDPWFKNNFPLKGNFLLVFQNVKDGIFGVNPYPDKVVEGDDGWLFLGDMYDRGLSEQLGYERMNETEIDDFTNFLSDLDNYCQKNNCCFIFMPILEKTSFYHKFIPLKKSDRPTTLELVILSAEDKGIKVVDVRKAFGKENQMQLYMKEDTHWNGIGAWLAYNQLTDTINHCFFNVKKLNSEDMNCAYYIPEETDLANFLHRKPVGYNFVITPKIEIAKPVEDKLKIPDYCPPFMYDLWENRFENPDFEKKVLVFRDSYFVSIVPFVKESFNETVLIWQKYPDTNLIKTEMPDIVIFEVLERMINDAYNEIKIHQKQMPACSEN